MSNIIPIVSSSPPPLDEGGALEWNDDDDDFGNFASAPGVQDAGGNGAPEFQADWSEAPRGSSPASLEGRESSSDRDTESFIEPKCDGVMENSGHAAGSGPSDPSSQEKDLDAGEDFADFAAFQPVSDNKSKPHIQSLPLHERFEDSKDSQSEGGGRGGAETGMEKSRESMTTDSGVFSTDLSPLPKSESFSDGDRVNQSEDETFSDITVDRQLDHEKCGTRTDNTSPPPESEPDQLVREADTDVASQPHTADRTSDECDKEPACPAMEDRESGGRDSAMAEGDAGGEDQSVGLQLSVDSGSGGSCQGRQHGDGCAQTAAEDASGAKEPRDSNKVSVVAEDIPGDDGADWAAFGAFPSEKEETGGESEWQQGAEPAEPADLVLRKDSVSLEEEEASQGDSELGNLDTPDLSPQQREEASSTPSSQCESKEEDVGSCDDFEEVGGKTLPAADSTAESGDKEEEHFGNFSSTAVTADEEEGEKSAATDNEGKDGSDDLSSRKDEHGPCEKEASEEEEDEFGDFNSLPATENQEQNDYKEFSTKPADSADSTDQDDFGDFSAKPAGTDSTDQDDFGDFSAKPADSADSTEQDDFGDFSTKPAGTDSTEQDDFGDFSAKPAGTDSTEQDDFGDFSAKPAGTDSTDQDDFGDFSATPAAPADSGWADFGSASQVAQDDNFGNFSQSVPVQANSNSAPSVAAASPSVSAAGMGAKFAQVLAECFPAEAGDREGSGSDGATGQADGLGLLETVLEYGLRHGAASQQTWQVVQHPARKEAGVKLWHGLQDLDGSPAVVFQWTKSRSNSRVFNTLSIDTQNMLIGHKKPSVPIFATGLSLLEPIRGGARESNQSAKSGAPSAVSTLVDPNERPDIDRPPQEIPAVDFDWSSSGLTNPLTSRSLDLDFLVVQDADSSDKAAVFQSEVLDAPRASARSSHPLEDILRNAKPTSVRSRHGNDLNPQLSREAARVLAGLPDLTFMQSKVLMFPIKN